MKNRVVFGTNACARLKKTLALLLMFSVASSTLFMLIPTLQATVSWGGWWVRIEGVWVEVTVSYEDDVVQARWWVNNEPPGSYRVRVMRDIVSRPDQAVETMYIDYDGGTHEYSLPFVPPYLTGEAGTNGYYMDLYGFFGETWVELWTMPNSYPPRLRVLGRYFLTIDVFGSGTTDPAPGIHRYPDGTDVPVEAIPAGGWAFYSWLLDGVDVGSSNPYTVTMDTDHDLTAVFVKPQTWYKIRVPGVGGGIIPCHPRGIALDSDNNPHIIYGQNWRLEPPWIYELCYTWYTGTTWRQKFLGGPVTMAVNPDASIVLDSQDRPHIACRTQDERASPEEILYAYRDGTDWVTETLYSTYIADLRGETSFALDSDDKPYITFCHPEDGLVLATKDPSGNWTFEIVDPEVDWTFPSLVLDSNDYPRISYFAGIIGRDVFDLIYAWWDGSTWNNETVDSHTIVEMTSLALDSNDYPHIGYGKLITGGGVIYAWWDGSTWNNETVDWGSQPSLALDSLDRPHMSYQCYVGYDLWYAWRVSTANGNIWVKQIVDSEDYVNGEHSSLVLDSLGNPHISYWDLDPAGWTLKYATPDPPNQAPVADANGPYTGTEDVPVTLDGSGSYDPDGIIVSYEWDFGDGNFGTGINPTHAYSQAGTYTVTLTVTDDRGAKDTDTTTATIIGPTADFSASPTSGPEPLTVSFTDLSTSYDGITAWEWDFDNNDVIDSTLQNPTHVYDLEGVYTVTLEVYEADGDNDVETKIDYIVVSDAVPIADFSGTPTSGSEPLTVDFTDQSTSYDGITSWEWDFDNNDVIDSTLQNPTHVYDLEGVYTVTLEVYEADGDNDVRTKINYIVISDAVPIADFSGTPRTGNPPLTVSFTDLSTSYDGKVVWVWNFGDGEFSTEQNPTHTYTDIGTYTASLTVYDLDGDSTTETKVNYIIVGFINVVFEEAHLSTFTIGSNFAYEVTGGYAGFANYLTSNGYFVSTIDPGTNIDLSVLGPVDVLVIVAPQWYYSTSEIDAIEAWVKDGGTLLLITDWGSFGLQASTIAARFGITQPFDMILDYDENLGTPYWPYYDGANLLAHPVTAGVTRVEMYMSDGITSAPADEVPLIVTDSDGSAAWYYSGQPAIGVSLMSAIDRGGTADSGRLIVITDSNLWESLRDFDGDGDVNFYDSDNEILALNAINWLSAVRHDVAVTDVTPSTTAVCEGHSMSINVTVENQGSHTETSLVTAYANTTSIAFQTVTLIKGTSTTITLTWNTTGFSYGNYTIRAVANTVPSEKDIADNTHTDGWVIVTIAGDVNGDGVVNASDIFDLSKAYGSTPDSPNWNPNCDLNGDDKVDASDLFNLSKNYGKTNPRVPSSALMASASLTMALAAYIAVPKWRKKRSGAKT